MPFTAKLPADLTEADLAELEKTLGTSRSGVLLPWANHLLKSLTPDQAVRALRQLPSGLWPKVAAAIVLSCRLYTQDEPPSADYDYLYDDPTVPPEEIDDRVQAYIESHLGPRYVTALGQL